MHEPVKKKEPFYQQQATNPQVIEVDRLQIQALDYPSLQGRQI